MLIFAPRTPSSRALCKEHREEGGDTATTAFLAKEHSWGGIQTLPPCLMNCLTKETLTKLSIHHQMQPSVDSMKGVLVRQVKV